MLTSAGVLNPLQKCTDHTQPVATIISLNHVKTVWSELVYFSKLQSFIMSIANKGKLFKSLSPKRRIQRIVVFWKENFFLIKNKVF